MVYVFLASFLSALWFVMIALQRVFRPGSAIFKSPYSWFVPTWLLQFILLALPLFAYNRDLSSTTAYYIIEAHLAFCSGIILCYFSRHRENTDEQQEISQRAGSSNVLLTIFTIGIISQIIYSVGGVLGSGLSLADRMDSDTFASARSANFEGSGNALGSLVGLFTILSSLLYVAIPYASFCWGARRHWMAPGRLLWFMLLGSALLVSLDYLIIQGGRINVLFVLLAILMPFRLGKEIAGIQKPRRLSSMGGLKLAILAILATIPSAAFQQFRSGHVMAPLDQIRFAHWAEISPTFLEAAQKDEFIAYYFVQTSYLTSSTTILQRYVELSEINRPGPYHGSLSFHAIYRNTFRFFPGFDPEYFPKLRQELWAPLTGADHLGNVWASLLRDQIADWGIGGSLVAMFIFGWLMQKITDSIYRRPSPSKMVFLTYLRIAALFSCLLSIFYLTGVQWGLIISLFMILWEKAFLALARKSRSGGARASADQSGSYGG